MVRSGGIACDMAMLRQLSKCDPKSEKATSGAGECKRYADYGLQHHPCRVLTSICDLTLALPRFNEIRKQRCCEEQSRDADDDACRTLGN